MQTCPNCGTHFNSSPGRAYSIGRFHVGGSAAAEAGEVSEFHAPARDATTQSDVTVPLLQAVITAAVCLFLAAVGMAIWGWPWWVPPAVFAAVLAVAWFRLLSDSRALLRTIERVESRQETRQELTAASVRLEIHEDRGRHIQFGHLPADLPTLQTLARGLQGGRPFSFGEWTGSGRLLTRSQFEDIRDWLLSAGYVAWQDEQHRRLGVEFTGRGRALLRALAERSSALP